ncbi:hypothetical protein HYY70_05560 [Candidatus Woesearchaeota archaeon]|nr:hypothetical protein [Candidatus Woesearchaeota archaeon]
MNKLIFKLFYWIGAFLLLLVVLGGCSPKISGNIIKEIPQEINKNQEVYFCPRQDCSKVYEKHISSANFSAYCAFYDINLRNVIRALARKSKNADVKVVLESSTYEEQIKGDSVRLDSNKQLMHNKFCVIDNDIVITGSFNPTDNDNNLNNNNIVVIHSKALAENYKDEFDELWNDEFGGGKKVRNPALYVNGIRIENFFCPEDGCALRVAELIKNAKNSIYFMAFSFTSEDIADTLIMKDGLDIRGIFDARQSSNRYSQFNRLKGFGIQVKKDSNRYTMHHKVFILDNETVVTGSFNPTLNADRRNDENLLVIHSKKITNFFLREFDMLWQQSA